MFPGEVTNDFSHMHELGLDLPEECVIGLQPVMIDGFWLQSKAFKKLYDYTLINPGDEMLTKAYEYYRDALKCIFYKGNTRFKYFRQPLYLLA